MAKLQRNAAAMVAAVQLRAKLNGLLVDKVKADSLVRGQVVYRAHIPQR